jgi:uncharacterized LabA/DUF88 family protein
MDKKRVAVYIDGFNLYHSINDLSINYLKWLNLWSLSEKLIRENEILVAVKYFTAYAKWRETSYRRHQRYVAALEEVGVEPIIGRFKEKSVRCQAKCRQGFTTHEEKETDVNIGVHLMADALQNNFDRALVISADTDITAAVRLARDRSVGKLIDVIAPPGRMSRNREIGPLFEISKGKLKKSLLPSIIKRENGLDIIRPRKYNPPEG